MVYLDILISKKICRYKQYIIVFADTKRYTKSVLPIHTNTHFF